MKRTTLTLCLLCLLMTGYSQSKWNTIQLAPMPEAISNNAVAAAEANGQTFMYSFSGMDTSKIYSGISLKALRYDVSNDVWDVIDSVPDTMGKIAAGASTVGNMIYIIGGYSVFQNGNEVSSGKTHIFDPEINSYLPDGMDIPVPIDDHIQAVWRDSLIYVVTGWSNSGNVNNVQVYNPSTDQWMAGTPTPNTNDYKVFGGSGVIIGDTIYYAGGAADWNGSTFPLTNSFRKGAIDPNDPTQITWSQQADTLAKGYRMGAAVFDNKAIWFGGSQNSYNYDGIAYDGSGGVEATGRIVSYNPSTGQLTLDTSSISAVMDIRGVARVAHNQFVIAGGMAPGQQVTDMTQLITYGQLTGNEIPLTKSVLSIYPNPASEFMYLDLGSNHHTGALEVTVFDIYGRIVSQQNISGSNGPPFPLAIDHLTSGLYLVQVRSNGRFSGFARMEIHR